MKSFWCGSRTWSESSPPSRGAWIEIDGASVADTFTRVAPLAGGVD